MELQKHSIHGKKLRNTATNINIAKMVGHPTFFPFVFFCSSWLCLSLTFILRLLSSKSFCCPVFFRINNMRSSGFWQGPACTLPPSLPPPPPPQRLTLFLIRDSCWFLSISSNVCVQKYYSIRFDAEFDSVLRTPFSLNRLVCSSLFAAKNHQTCDQDQQKDTSNRYHSYFPTFKASRLRRRACDDGETTVSHQTHQI